MNPSGERGISGIKSFVQQSPARVVAALPRDETFGIQSAESIAAGGAAEAAGVYNIGLDVAIGLIGGRGLGRSWRQRIALPVVAFGQTSKSPRSGGGKVKILRSRCER